MIKNQSYKMKPGLLGSSTYSKLMSILLHAETLVIAGLNVMALIGPPALIVTLPMLAMSVVANKIGRYFLMLQDIQTLLSEQDKAVISKLVNQGTDIEALLKSVKDFKDLPERSQRLVVLYFDESYQTMNSLKKAIERAKSDIKNNPPAANAPASNNITPKKQQVGFVFPANAKEINITNQNELLNTAADSMFGNPESFGGVIKNSAYVFKVTTLMDDYKGGHIMEYRVDGFKNGKKILDNFRAGKVIYDANGTAHDMGSMSVNGTAASIVKIVQKMIK